MKLSTRQYVVAHSAGTAIAAGGSVWLGAILPMPYAVLGSFVLGVTTSNVVRWVLKS